MQRSNPNPNLNSNPNPILNANPSASVNTNNINRNRSPNNNNNNNTLMNPPSNLKTTNHSNHINRSAPRSGYQTQTPSGNSSTPTYMNNNNNSIVHHHPLPINKPNSEFLQAATTQPSKFVPSQNNLQRTNSSRYSNVAPASTDQLNSLTENRDREGGNGIGSLNVAYNGDNATLDDSFKSDSGGITTSISNLKMTIPFESKRSPNKVQPPSSQYSGASNDATSNVKHKRKIEEVEDKTDVMKEKIADYDNNKKNKARRQLKQIQKILCDPTYDPEQDLKAGLAKLISQTLSKEFQTMKEQFFSDQIINPNSQSNNKRTKFDSTNDLKNRDHDPVSPVTPDERLQILNKQLEALRKTNEGLETEVSSLKRTNRDLEQQVKSLQIKVEKIKTEPSQIVASYQTNVDNLNAKLKELNEKKEKLSGENEKLLREKQEDKQTMEELQKKLKELKRDTSAKSLALASLQDQNQSLKSHLDSLDNERKIIQQEQQEHLKAKQDLEKENEVLKSQNSKHLQDLEAEKSKSAQKALEKKKLMEELNMYQKLYEQLKKENKNESEQRTSHQQITGRYKEKCKKMEIEVSKVPQLQKQNEELQAKVLKLESALIQIYKRLQQVQKKKNCPDDMVQIVGDADAEEIISQYSQASSKSNATKSL
eukprot:TRINITY_DN4718_c0_g2_i1.p1 TRINITY_DN4718_c0_g2~~TRINITY_DN4718_c0_g2_i1.p1  ORF type:complete len:652 (-),score=184.63 TRINITY_DN4718_c0_g2_i1:121-2076(-)